MARKLAYVMVFLLALSAFPTTPMTAAAEDSHSPRYECEFDCPGTVNFVYNDTDGDGLYEIFCYANGFTRCIDPPGFETVISVDDADNSNFPSIKDIDGNGTIGIILVHSNSWHYNYSIYSGKDFRELWRSPDINGTVSSPLVKDIDGDGQAELVSVTQNGGLSQIHIFGALNHEFEWSSGLYPNENGNGYLSAQNLDSDSATELLFEVSGRSLAVYDGASHELEWEIPFAGNFTFDEPYPSPQDYDGDGLPELLLQYHEFGPGADSHGFRRYSAGNGTVEWDMPLQDGPMSYRVYDDGTGAWNLLLQNRTGDYPNVYNYTCDVFSLQNHSLIWQAGPWAQNDTYNSYIDAYDFNGDGRDEIIIRNSTAERQGSSSVFAGGTWELLNGSDFTHLWTSPMLEGYANVQLSPYGTENESYFVLVSNPKDGEYGSTNCTVTIVSASNYSMIWRSEKYPGTVEAHVDDYVGDSAYEILVSVQYRDGRGDVSYLYDMTDLSLIWTSPPSHSQAFPFCLYGAPLAGPDRNELIFVNASSETVHSGHSTYTHDISTITVYDNITLEEVWRSDTLPGYWWIRGIWDFDNDSNMEALFTSEDHFSSISGSVAIIEFPRDKRWAAGIDNGPPSVRIMYPVDGSGIKTDINITGDARDDRSVDAVLVRIDNGSWLDAVKQYAGGNGSCNWTYHWNISGIGNGTHMISARAFDGLSWSRPASVNITILPVVKEPPGGNGTGRVPGTTIGDLPVPICAAAAGLAMMSIAAVLLSRRRKTRP